MPFRTFKCIRKYNDKKSENHLFFFSKILYYNLQLSITINYAKKKNFIKYSNFSR